MALKFGQDDVTSVIFNTNNTDYTVNKVILDGTTVWVRPFQYTQGELPEGVAYLTCTLFATDELTVDDGITIYNGDTIYYDDLLQFTAEAEEGYSVSYNTGDIRVTDDIDGIEASEIEANVLEFTYYEKEPNSDFSNPGIESISCTRVTSPLKHANTGTISDGDPIYYGDTLRFTVTVKEGYDLNSYSYHTVQYQVTSDVLAEQVTNPDISRVTWSLVITKGDNIKNYSYTNSNGTESQTFTTNQITVSGIDYDETITVTATAQSETPYNYGPIDGDGEFSFSDANAQRVATTTLTCTRELKKYKYYTGTPPIGVASLTCYRYSSEQSGVVYGVVNNEDDIYYGDILYWEATASTGYTVSISHNSSNTITVTSDITGSSSAGITVTRLTWSYTVYLGTGQTEFQYKVNNGGYMYSYGDRTISDLDYADVLTIQGTAATTGYDPDTTVYTRTFDNSGGSIILTATLKTYTVTWSYQDSYGHWTSTTTIVTHGDTPTPPVTPSTVTSGSYRQYYLDWDNLSAVTGTRTITATYKQQYYLTFDPYRGCTCNRNSGWYDENTSSKLTVIWTALSNWAFSSDGGTTSSTVFIYITEPKTYSYGADYLYVTIKNNTGCSADLQTGWQEYNAVCTWTCSSGYGFNDSGYAYATANLTTPGGTYSKTPSYGYLTVSTPNNHCTASRSSGWLAISGNSYTVRFTSKAGWSFGGQGQYDYVDVNVNVPGTASGDPAYFYLTITGNNTNISHSSGFYTASTKPSSIVWTAYAAYAFDTSNTSEVRETSISTGPATYTHNADYVKRYTLTIQVTSGQYYGTYYVKRISSPYQGATTPETLSNNAIIYYGDVLEGGSSPNGQSGVSWDTNFGTVTTPTASASGNVITVVNQMSTEQNVVLYYNTSNAAGGTSMGYVSGVPGRSKSATVSYSTTYYCSASTTVSRSGHYYTYYKSDSNYTGTSFVSGDVTASFSFGRNTNYTSESTTGYSGTVSVTTGAGLRTVTFNNSSTYANDNNVAQKVYVSTDSSYSNVSANASRYSSTCSVLNGGTVYLFIIFGYYAENPFTGRYEYNDANLNSRMNDYASDGFEVVYGSITSGGFGDAATYGTIIRKAVTITSDSTIEANAYAMRVFM